MTNSTKCIKNSFTIITLACNVIWYSFRSQVIKTFFVNLYSFIKFFKVIISTVPKIIQLFPFIRFCRILFRTELFLYCCWRRLKFDWRYLSQEIFVIFSQKNKFSFTIFKDRKIVPLFFFIVRHFLLKLS